MKRLLLAIAALCAILFATAALPVAAQEVVLETPGKVRVLEMDDRPELAKHLVYMANKSRAKINARCDLMWDDPVTIVWCDQKEYLDRTGFRPENTAAAAAPSLLTIYINESAWLRSDTREQETTLTHEMAHLMLGSLPGRDVPLWANEGIVMHLADQWSWDEQLMLLAAHATGSLPKLAALEQSFPRDGNLQSLAYRTGYAAVDVVAESYGDERGSLRRFLQRLADPNWGPQTAQELYDPWRRGNWQAAMEHSLGSRYSTAMIVLTSTGAIFLVITFLVIIAYLVVKHKRRQRAAQYVREREAWEESLTEQDIADIYGDKEEKWKLEDEPPAWQPEDEDGEGWKRR